MRRPEAWAKNIVACGGILHNDTLTRGDDSWGGFVSIGPAADGRIKPDLTHFADSIFCPFDGSNTDYIGSFNGSSSATGITAGAFGLLTQMWHEQVFNGFGGGASVFADRPHASTARALMIHSAYRYAFTGAGADLTRTHQGWGMADLQNLYNLRTGMFIVNETTSLTHLAHARYQFNVSGATPLRVTMVYKDLPGNTAASVARINDLSVKVTSPSAEVFWGNNGLLTGNWSTSGGVSNTVDTVENVFIENPAAGTWVVEVFADEVVEDADPATQPIDAPFALVVSGGVWEQCRVDWYADGMITPSDIAAFISDWVSSLANQTTLADYDQNGSVDPSDIAQFVTDWLAALGSGRLLKLGYGPFRMTTALLRLSARLRAKRRRGIVKDGGWVEERARLHGRFIMRGSRTPGCCIAAALAMAALQVAMPVASAQTLTTTRVAFGFTQPIYLTSPPGDARRLFIVEKGGKIKIIKDGVTLGTPFLDMTSIVNSTTLEWGLLSMTFDPFYAQNGYFYVNYNTGAGGDSAIARFQVAGDPASSDVADFNSRLTLLYLVQPNGNHRGGWLAFGPDGYLYDSQGDGGGQSDPSNRGQNITLLQARFSASMFAPTISQPIPTGTTGFPRPIPSSASPALRARSSPTACETRGAAPSTGSPATSGSATSDRTSARRSTASPPARAGRTSAGDAWRGPPAPA